MNELSTAAVTNPSRGASAAHTVGPRSLWLPSVRGGNGELLDASIRRISTVFSEPSGKHWAIRTPGMRHIAGVDLSAEWLSVTMSLRLITAPMSVKMVASALTRNAGIEGISRIVRQREPGRRQIIADIPVETVPWDSESDLDELLCETIAGLNVAYSPPLQYADSPARSGLSHEQLVAMFDEAGWPVQQGECERLEIPLDVPGNYFLATVDQDSRSTGLSVPILAAELGNASKQCREAVAVLLWLTSSRIRMVKATQMRRCLAFEASLPPAQVSASGLAHACGALSSALRQVAKEAELLIADVELARTYLSILEFPTSA